jgi:metallo-beta-lactamase class B
MPDYYDGLMKIVIALFVLLPGLLYASCAGLSGESLTECKKGEGEMLRHAQDEAKRVNELEASTPQSWGEATEPVHIGGPLYYVGTQGIAVYLIKTKKGLILLGGATSPSGPVINDSIQKVGFKPSDIKLLLVSHGHFDHVGSLGYFKAVTEAPVLAGQGDVELLKSGGKADYLFAKDSKFHFDPVTVDRVVKDKEVVELGGVKMIAHATPGHTPGCITWEMKFREGRKKYSVVFLDGTTINPGTKFTKTPSYPGILDDYRKTFRVLNSLKPDIFLSYHSEVFDFESKRAVAKKAGLKAWVDKSGYAKFVAKKQAEFEQYVVE